MTIKSGAQESTFPGTLSLPSPHYKHACITRENLDLPQGEDQLFKTELSFDSKGKADSLLSAERSYDSDGFGFTNTLSVGNDYASVTAHSDNTLFLTRKDSFAVKSPISLAQLGQTSEISDAERVTYQSKLPGLSFHYTTTKPSLEPMQAALLKVDFDPAAATFAPPDGSKVEFTRAGDQWKVQAGQGQSRSFSGSLDQEGKMVSGKNPEHFQTPVSL